MNNSYMIVRRLLMFVLIALVSTSTYAQRGARVFKAIEKAAKEINIKKAREIKMTPQNVENMERRGNNIERQYNAANNVGSYRRPSYPMSTPPKKYIPTNTPAGKSHRVKSRDYSPYRVAPYAAAKAANGRIVQCPACRGTGKNYYGNTCNICGGSGLVSASAASSYKAKVRNMLYPQKPQQNNNKKRPLRTIGIIALILCGVFFLRYIFKG